MSMMSYCMHKFAHMYIQYMLVNDNYAFTDLENHTYIIVCSQSGKGHSHGGRSSCALDLQIKLKDRDGLKLLH